VKPLESFSGRIRRRLWPSAPTGSLEELLSAADPLTSLSGRVEWLHGLVQWLRAPIAADEAKFERSTRIQSARLRYLFQTLDRHPHWKANVAGVLRSILEEASAVDLFSATGLSREFGFVSEASDRIQRKLLPAPADDSDLSSLFNRIFLDESDPDWIDTLPEDLVSKFTSLVLHEAPDAASAFIGLRHAMVDALLILAPTIASIGLAQDLRSRMDDRSVGRSPFRSLNEKLTALAPMLRDPEAVADTSRMAEVADEIRSCRERVADVYEHLEEAGVSVALVFRLERLSAALSRVETLLGILAPAPGGDRMLLVKRFCGYLIRQSLESGKLRSLIGSNLDLLSRKVVERVGLAGDRYIMATGAEYWGMLKSGAGGGVVTVLTTVLKFVISSAKLPLFFEGFFQFLNYAGSFLFMQWMHFSLATKQPSMTASALANKLKSLNHRQQLEEFVDEVTKITRSQFAAAAGNVGLVIPSAFAFELLFRNVTGGPVLDAAHANQVIASFNPFTSVTVPAAALTGVILWMSAVSGGWLENWAVFRRLPEAIATHRGLLAVFGAGRAQAFAEGFARNIAGIGSNVTIGFLLAFTPVIGRFFGLPLDIRHVTLSAGSLTFAIGSVGWENVSGPAVAMACIGIVLILILNFGVSFALALFVALRARRIKRAWVYHLLLGVGRRFRRNGLQFFIPRG
jgi:site-specific recombinase